MYLRDYLDERAAQGERIHDDTPLLGFDPRGRRKSKKNLFLRTTLVTRDIKSAILKAGYSWRPYVLRAYFDTNMIIAESKGSISHPYLQFMMGHKGDIESRYSTNKSLFPPDMIEDMRMATDEVRSTFKLSRQSRVMLLSGMRSNGNYLPCQVSLSRKFQNMTCAE